jgi:hypothetical protein
MVALQELAAHQPQSCGVIGEDTDDVGASLELFVQSLKRVITGGLHSGTAVGNGLRSISVTRCKCDHT